MARFVHLASSKARSGGELGGLGGEAAGGGDGDGGSGDGGGEGEGDTATTGVVGVVGASTQLTAESSFWEQRSPLVGWFMHLRTLPANSPSPARWP